MPRLRNSPSERWRREHGTKVVHASWLRAALHAVGLSWRKRRRLWVWHAYECRWAQWYYDGETAEPHWHVGRHVRK